MEAYLTRKEISAILKVTSETIRNLEKRGMIIPAIYINGRPRYKQECIYSIAQKGGESNGSNV